MNNFQKYGIAAFTVALMGMGIASTFATSSKQSPPPAAPAAPASAAPAAKADNTVLDKGWTVRCPDKTKTTDKKSCEVFSRLEMKSSSLRVAEFAVGFPADKSLPKGSARGVIIMPLGISLEAGTSSMKIDDGNPFAFSSKFCTQAGCFSFVNLDKDILDSMKKGKALNIFFKTSNNQDAHMIMDLSSFKKAFSNIE